MKNKPVDNFGLLTEHPECLVIWQDQTYDYSRVCTMCGTKGVCQEPVHAEKYQVKGVSKIEEKDKDLADNSEESQSYWNWMDLNSPFGGDGSALATGGDFVHAEAWAANPDSFHEQPIRSSGVSEQHHVWMQEAVAQLSPRRQEIWDLAMRQQLPITVIAERLGIAHPTVSVHLSRSKQIVSEYLRNKQDETSA